MFHAKAGSEIRSYLVMTMLKVCQAFLSLLSIQGIARNQESNVVILLLLLYTLMNFAYTFDLGLSTKIGNRFQSERSLKSDLASDLVLLFRQFLGSFYKYISLAVSQAILLVAIVHHSEVVNSSHSKLRTYCVFSLIVVISYVCGNINKFLILLERQSTLALLNIGGLIIQNIILYSNLFKSSFLLMAFCLVLPVIFVSLCILLGSYYITRRTHLEIIDKESFLDIETRVSFSLGLSQLLQYVVASTVPILLSSKLSDEEFFQFSILLKVFGFIGSVSGAFIQNNWQRDAFQFSRQNYPQLSVLRFSRRDLIQILNSFALTLPLTLVVICSWSFFTSVYMRPDFVEIGLWIVASTVQVCASQSYFKLISIQAYGPSLVLFCTQSLTLLVLCFLFYFYSINYLYLILGPLVSFLMSYFLIRRIIFERREYDACPPVFS